jgi:hypothetical protein
VRSRRTTSARKAATATGATHHAPGALPEAGAAIAAIGSWIVERRP